MEPVTTPHLMAAALENPGIEIQDFDAVVERYWPRIFRFALASLRDPDAAESLTQDCFLRAYRGRGGFRGDASLNTWLMQIAVNLVRDFGRNRRLQFWKRTRTCAVDLAAISDSLPGREASPETRACMLERVASVWKATEELSERQRTVFLLRFVEDLELLEISAATGLSEGAVKVHLFRALQAVRKKMGKPE